MALSDMRKDYQLRGLDERDVDPDPLRQYRLWLEEAIAADLPEPNAMTLATVSAEGRPSARMVLLKEVDEAGFIFYSNYESRKGRELTQTPWAALICYWATLERQVRIEGSVARLSASASDAYFQSRPIGSQLGAWASPQSQIITSRDVLNERLQEVSERFQDSEHNPIAPLPRPPFWGGYCVTPDAIEFWQGRSNRLHDRLRYRRGEEQLWVIERLAP